MSDCLIVVDMQNDFCDPAIRPGALEGCGPVAENIDRLAAGARRAGVPLVWIRTEHSEASDTPVWVARHPGSGRICRPGTPGVDFYRVRPEPGEAVLTKHRYSAFIGTDLEARLHGMGVSRVVCCGVLTNVCVESTARDAFQRDFAVIVAGDACRAPSPEIHAAALANVRGHFGHVATVDEVARLWSQAARRPVR